MIQGLFFNWIHCDCSQPPVNFGIEDAAFILPHAADAVFSVVDDTVVRAEPALHCGPVPLFIKIGLVFFHYFVLLQRASISMPGGFKSAVSRQYAI